MKHETRIDCLSIILHSGFFTYHLVLKNLWVLLAQTRKIYSGRNTT